MKKTLLLLALLALLFTQCKPKIDELNNEDNSGKVRLSCVMPVSDGAKSDFTNLMTDGSVRWGDGKECIYLAIPGETPQIVKLESHSEGYQNSLEFTADVDENLLTSGTSYEIWYFGNSHKLTSPYFSLSNDNKIEGSIATQSGRLSDMGYCHIASTTVTAITEDGIVRLLSDGPLENKMAIALLDLSNVSSLSGSAIIGTSYSLEYNSTNEKFDFKVTENPNASISVESADGISYVALLPNEIGNVALNCQINSQNYEYIFVNGVNVNKVYYRTEQNGDISYLPWTLSEEVPSSILLSADKSSILANDSDVVTFTVMQDDTDVTGQCTFFVNENQINGNTFKTSTAGDYTVYAKKEELQSETITITANESGDGLTTIVWADGVTRENGWYDVNKVGAGENGDINMCWAASASNIIQWWQDCYEAAGKSLPEGAITGPGANGTYQLALMDMYHDRWDNNMGAEVQQAITWYFDGRNTQKYSSVEYNAQPLHDGGYYAAIWQDQILPYTYHEYVAAVPEFNNLICGEILAWNTWQNVGLNVFTELVVDAFEKGIASLTISLNANGGLRHATTMWGYEINNTTGLLTKIWITDSDDLETEPKTAILHECTVSYDGKNVVLNGVPRYGNFYANALYPVSKYGSIR